MLSSDAVDERRRRRRYLKQFVFPLNFFQCNQHFKSLKGLATKASKDRVLPSMYAIRGGMAEDGGERIVGKAQLMEGDADQFPAAVNFHGVTL